MMGLLKLDAITAGSPLSMCVENFKSLILALACGVTSPLKRASTANGTDGSGVCVAVGRISGVLVRANSVGLFSGVSVGAEICVNSGVGRGVRV